MLRKQHPNTKSLILFLNLLKIKVNKSSVKKIFESHPDWPSFLSINDSLNHWKINNVVARIHKENFDEIPFPFIAYLKNREYPLAIVTSADSDYIKILDEELNKPTKHNREAILSQWDGTVLVAEKQPLSGEKNYEKIRIISMLNSFVTILIPVLLFTLGLVFLTDQLNIYKYNQETASKLILIYIHLSISISVSALIVWYEIDNSNSFISKVCSSFSNTNCFAVFNSKAAKLFNIFSWSEIGLFYYLFGFVYFITNYSNGKNFIDAISLFYILSFWYPFYSIYFQWKIIRQWCVLCLTIQFLIICSVFLVNYNISLQNIIPFFIEFKPLLIFMIIIFLWSKLKPILTQNVKLKEVDLEYNRLKFNEIVFNSLLKNQDKITVNYLNIGIEIGDVNARYTLVKVCNPYCDPCSRAHYKLTDIIENNKNIKVRIIFNVSPNDEFAKKPVNLFLYYFKDAKKTETGLRILSKWHLQNEKNYNEFIKAEKIDTSKIRQEYSDEIEKMYNWCKEMNVHSTPTYFINDNKMPNFYLIEEINYFFIE